MEKDKKGHEILERVTVQCPPARPRHGGGPFLPHPGLCPEMRKGPTRLQPAGQSVGSAPLLEAAIAQETGTWRCGRDWVRGKLAFPNPFGELPPQLWDVYQHLKTFLVSAMGEGCCWPARDAAEHPTGWRTAPYNKECL